MSLREEVIADWNRRKSLRYPPSWRGASSTDIHLDLAESYAAGCIHTYVNYVKPGEALDEERVQYLIGCRETFIEAQSIITDDEGRFYLELYLRMAKMVLADGDAVRANAEVQASHHAKTSANG